MSLPQGAVGWSVVCDGGISYPYSHTFGNATSTLLKNTATSGPYDMATSLHNRLLRYINTF